MLGRELTPLDCSRHVVRRQQMIGRRTSFWSMGLLPVSSSLTTISKTGPAAEISHYS